MYRHIKNYELRYTDVDAYDNIKLSALLGLLQESACLSADELGFGYNDVKGYNLGFILANWYVKIFRPVKIGETLEVHTWPLKPKHLIFLRDYEFFINGEKIGVASARWCMISTCDFTFVPIAKHFADGFFDGYNTERSIEFNAWKIAQLEGGKEVYKKRVGYCDYDHYFHANNTKYADFLMDVFSVGELRGKFVSEAQISYVKQCKEGEELIFYRDASEDGFSVVEGKVDGEVRVQMRVKLGDL